MVNILLKNIKSQYVLNICSMLLCASKYIGISLLICMICESVCIGSLCTNVHLYPNPPRPLTEQDVKFGQDRAKHVGCGGRDQCRSLSNGGSPSMVSFNAIFNQEAVHPPCCGKGSYIVPPGQTGGAKRWVGVCERYTPHLHIGNRGRGRLFHGTACLKGAASCANQNRTGKTNWWPGNFWINGMPPKVGRICANGYTNPPSPNDDFGPQGCDITEFGDGHYFGIQFQGKPYEQGCLYKVENCKCPCTNEDPYGNGVCGCKGQGPKKCTGCIHAPRTGTGGKPVGTCACKVPPQPPIYH